MNTSLLYGPLQLLQKKVSNYRMYLGLNEENIIMFTTTTQYAWQVNPLSLHQNRRETDPKMNSYGCIIIDQ